MTDTPSNNAAIWRGREPAAPTAEYARNIATGEEYVAARHAGLTKREHFAGLAMQGLLANPNRDFYHADLADEATKHADALLAELAK